MDTMTENMDLAPEGTIVLISFIKNGRSDRVYKRNQRNYEIGLAIDPSLVHRIVNLDLHNNFYVQSVHIIHSQQAIMNASAWNRAVILPANQIMISQEKFIECRSYLPITDGCYFSEQEIMKILNSKEIQKYQEQYCHVKPAENCHK